MKKKGLVYLVASLVMIAGLIIPSACAPTPPGEEVTPPPGEEVAPPPEIVRITISGGTVGGTTNLCANTLAVIAAKFTDAKPTVIIQPTMGHTHAVQTGLSDVGTAPVLTAVQAYLGEGPWEGKPWKDSRTLFYVSDFELQILVPEKSPISSFSDCIGKRLVLGKKGFMSDFMVMDLCDVFGIEYGKDFEPFYMGHPDAAAALLGGKVDAIFAAGAPPHPTYSAADVTHPLRLVEFTDEELAAILKAKPYYVPITIPKGVYKGVKEDVKILSHPMIYQTSTALPEDLAYDLVKNFYEHPDVCGMVYKLIEEMNVNGMLKEYCESVVSAPFHVGAYKYIQEQGWTIPEEMIPPEAS